MRKILMPVTTEKPYAVAGEAFQQLYAQVTGETLPFIQQDDGESDLIVIGSDAVNDFTATLFAQDCIDDLHIRYGTDDYTLLSVPYQGRMALVLAGGRGRSTLYAVYDYFERAAGCHYYWDGDVIPKKESLPLEGFQVQEKPRFEYRGLRYFAHRGLHRFQAEHWSLEDWKREIDWMVKRRMNYFMLRIGVDDVFQRAFPKLAAYPSAAETMKDEDIPNGVGPHSSGYDDRSLFWPLEYRGKLREQLLSYARERDVLHSEDCGTMTHWYSRTPMDYLKKQQPKLLAQESEGYNQATGLCWDPRDRENMENYFKLTETYCKEYGEPRLFHTIGLAERFIFKEREKNFKLKLFTYRRILQGIRERYPDAKTLIASWDFLVWWHPEDVQRLMSELDPEHTLILDYTSEGNDPEHCFLNWGMMGRFPWIFGMFQAYESQSSIRGPYDLTSQRLAAAKEDPQCKGMIYWPELSHSDTLSLEYLARNSWRPEQLKIEALTESFAHDRYGQYGDAMNAAWQKYLPLVKMFSWGGGCTREPDDPKFKEYAGWERYRNYMTDMLNVYTLRGLSDAVAPSYAFECEKQNAAWENAGETLDALTKLPEAALENPFVLRDVVDIARSVVEQRIHHGIMALLLGIRAFQQGKDNQAVLDRHMDALYEAAKIHAAIIGCHPDYSMQKTMEEISSVCPVAPGFEKTLKRNLVNGYCRQAAYEPETGLFLKENEAYYGWVRENMAANRREKWAWTMDDTEQKLYDQFIETPLAALQPDCDAGKLPELIQKAAAAVRAIKIIL